MPTKFPRLSDRGLGGRSQQRPELNPFSTVLITFDWLVSLAPLPKNRLFCRLTLLAFVEKIAKPVLASDLVVILPEDVAGDVGLNRARSRS